MGRRLAQRLQRVGVPAQAILELAAAGVVAQLGALDDVARQRDRLERVAVTLDAGIVGIEPGQRAGKRGAVEAYRRRLVMIDPVLCSGRDHLLAVDLLQNRDAELRGAVLVPGRLQLVIVVLARGQRLDVGADPVRELPRAADVALVGVERPMWYMPGPEYSFACPPITVV